jgi:amidase
MPHERSRERPVDRELLRAVARDRGLGITDDEFEEYAAFVADLVDGLDRLDELPSPVFPDQRPTYTDRPPGRRPDPDEDPLNAWITKTHVEGADSGPLAGYEVGLKDCIALAGYELTMGSTMFEGFVPRIDATVTTRLLEAGATITGKLNMDSFANGGSGEMSDFGPVRNPNDAESLAGGSSSGSAAAVAADECDVAIGSDQGGSVRIPGAWCGVVGVKPTTGLVPYTGAVPVNLAFDTLGVLATSVDDAATTLEVIAGEDRQRGVPVDPRQPRGVEAEAYAEATGTGVEGLSVGVLTEGFGLDVSDPDVDETVRDTVDELEEAGVRTEEVSVPLHSDAMSVLMGVALQGEAQLLDDDLVGTNQSGWFWRGLARVFGRFDDASGAELPITLKSTVLAAASLRETDGLSLYAKAKNLAVELERQVTAALEDHDALVVPTVPFLPYALDTDRSAWERVKHAHGMASNTATFSLTHHPAVTVPCGAVDGMPVGAMLVGAHFEESTLFRLADGIH